ncbi:hypothetical protein BH10PSE12_BH10PSE12_37840 [soil metagenome]
MGMFAILLIALAGWMVWTGRLQRMTPRDGIALGVAILGAVMAAKGKPLIGAVPLLASVGYAALRVRSGPRKNRTPPAPQAAPAVSEARALLGLPADANAEAIKAAHRRLIATVHPDRGGTEALAAKINAARDILLQHHRDTAG